MSALAPQARWLLAALCVLLYAALCLGLWRRARRRARAARAEAAALAAASAGSQPVLVAYASQTGQAEAIAHETARLLHTAGEPVHLCALGAVDAALLARTRTALFVASTYGEGDAPDNAAAFQQGCMARPLALAHLRCGVLALGDRQYARFCGFGQALAAWLAASGAEALFDAVEMDNGAPEALRRWQQHLGQVALLDATPAWQAPAFAPWRLAERIHLNPGSAGGAVFHLAFAPPPGVAADWQSGDLAEVRVPADPARPRNYSIASIAADGCVHLLVRAAVRADGRPGLASQWLCQGLAPGATVDMRLRPHGNFRLAGNAGRPLILIGNGTGLAGLRGHLRARAAQGAGPNWLVFGERAAAHDFLHREELLRWQAEGVLARLDLAFSRDQAQRIYVQHRLAAQAGLLRDWVLGQGAALYVCGSLQGMAQGVDEALRTVLGDAVVDAMVRDGRLRRDVY